MNEHQVDSEHEEHDEDDIYFGRFRPIKAKGLPSRKSDKKSVYYYSDWDED